MSESGDQPIEWADGIPRPEELRRELQDLVIQNLLGPANGREEILRGRGRVSDRYVLGMLAAKRQRMRAGTDDDFVEDTAGSSEEGTPEPTSAPPESTLPSSMGLSFTLHGDVAKIEVLVSWGRYKRVMLKGDVDESDADDFDPETGEFDEEENEEVVEEEREKPKSEPGWQRIPVDCDPVPVRIAEGDVEPIVPAAEFGDVKLTGRIRRLDDTWLVTLFLVNGQPEPERVKDEAWLFQPKIVIRSPDGSPVFVRRPVRRDPERMDPETFHEYQEMAMLYRRHAEFAVGHGVSVHVTTPDDDLWHANCVETCVVPEETVLQVTPPTVEDKGFEGLADLVLSMKDLSNERQSPEELADKLRPLTKTYANWIHDQANKIEEPGERLTEHRAAAEGVLARCDRACERIEEGIDLLCEDRNAFAAFLFANRAMMWQRVHSKFAEAKRRGDNPSRSAIASDAANFSWYPFQLAFLLLNLPTSTRLDHPDRNDETEALADLLWFPTGGGKTEAYFGLAAYVMALRRLHGEIEGRDGQHGVAVLMRYTLRLLTLQQFQRASTLICACEVIRRSDPETWGTEPFRIGLWVGRKASPNWTKQAAAVIEAARDPNRRAPTGVGSPAQLTNCPWCGSSLEEKRDFVAEIYSQGRGRTFTYCSDDLGNCQFSEAKSPGEGIPVVVVDEEIYRRLPALLIATVDKYAQLPWQAQTQMLFGQVQKLCGRHGFRSPETRDADRHNRLGNFDSVQSLAHKPLRPPDLVIQDELHLISGPLGSLVGIYETAIDELCTWTVDGKRVRPKVIASTATIRNARSQVHSLFLRKVEVFPPPGVDISDNFFALQRKSSEESPGRLYIGVCAPGKRLKAVLIRVYLAYMAAGQKLYEKYGKAIDPWMTTLGYFNSLRELGGMRRLVDDDVRVRLRGVERWDLANRAVWSVEELTSRKSSTDIPRILDRLEISFDPTIEAKRKATKNRRALRVLGPRPYDVVLATNMVSVGVDVGRLGLMVVAGQPKTTAEYIQATSRVGRRRDGPGLVCAVFNWARPRDLSHYERFEHYHATFYERVESLSLTPFAERALDRALSALLVSLVRLPGFEFNENLKAGQIDASHTYLADAIDSISRRAALVSGSNEFGDRVRDQLTARKDEWLHRAQRQTGARLGYVADGSGETVSLLSRPSTRGWRTFTCLNSLRDVEPLCGFILKNDPTDPSASSDPASFGASFDETSDEDMA